MSIATVTLNPTIDKTFSVPRVVPERKLQGRDVADFPGGGGINVARVASRLGARVNALWSCGGATGENLAALLDAERIQHHPVPIAGSVRENLIVRDESCDHQLRFGLPGPRLSVPERNRWLDEVGRVAANVDHVVISGSLPPGVPEAWFGDLLRAVPGTARLLVDTKQQALRAALDVGVHLIKPNVRELEELVDRELTDDADVTGAARELIDTGAAQVILVSLGRGGAMLVTADGAVRLSAPAVPMRSKVGAGDSMVGGLITALDRGDSVAESARLAVAAGAAAVMTPGTELCHPEDVLRLVQRVQVQAPAP